MKKITAIFLLVVALSSCYAQTAPSFVTDSLDNYVNKAIKEAQVPGLAVCIVKDGNVTFKTYGVKELGKNDKVDENTLFMIGSNTKAMTSIALAMLQEQKKLSLDDKVTKWLPDFKMKDPWVTKETNIRDLLCHRLGMETFQGDFMYWTSNLTSKQVIEKFGMLTPMHSFRGKWGYTNAAFVVAGDVIQAASGKPWNEYLTENIFRPLGMNRTFALSKELATASNKAVPHTFNHDQQLVAIPFPNLDNLGPAGSVGSSVTDMSKWVLMLLNNGQLNNQRIISANGIGQTTMPHSIIGGGGHMFNKTHFNLYGLGWVLNDYNGKKLISHTGGVNGFVTSVTLVPEEKLGIVVLTNTDQNALYEAVKWEILDAYLKLPYRNYANVYVQGQNQQMKQATDVWKKKADTVAMRKSTTLPLNAYAGEYRHDVYGWIKIDAAADHLVMSFQHHPHLKGRLDPLGGDRFVCTYNDPVFGRKIIPFVSSGNAVKSFTLRVADFLEFTTYEFTRK
ncbi:MAG TPA: serine hydrolase [Chitinophagaceae bacterium]|nr:serine hydrolase [Chitinophagaceae bacterium]